MGLFDRRKNSGGNQQNLSEYAGMRLEVMDEDGRMLFVARSSVTWDGTMELQPITVPHLDHTSSLSVTMRGYEEAIRKAVHMEGELEQRANSTWRVSSFHVTGKDNDRAFYRQETSAEGDVMPMKQMGVMSNPCRLVNISAGGVCIHTDINFRVGEKLLLRSNRVGDLQLPPLICVVRRVSRRKQGYEYGCEFVDLRPAVEDAIARAIMEMQRKRMRRE
ncbi:MAG: PilZ domain-containing protein [Oscillospiraceae bacterium]|nr:PilZ domain-containing protein [Oscillospiraceae bacterium]